MIFVERWLAATALAFILFPVAFVLWHGPDSEFGFFGGIMLMMFIQFISPFALWRIPLAVGTVFALVWHIHAKRRAVHRAD